MFVKKGFISRITFGDEVVIMGSRRTIRVKVELFFSF